jgi:hypothetical protein
MWAGKARIRWNGGFKSFTDKLFFMRAIEVFQTLNEEFLKPFSEDWLYGHFYQRHSYRGDSGIAGVADAIVGAGIGYSVGGPVGMMAGMITGLCLPTITYCTDRYLSTR